MPNDIYEAITMDFINDPVYKDYDDENVLNALCNSILTKVLNDKQRFFDIRFKNVDNYIAGNNFNSVEESIKQYVPHGEKLLKNDADIRSINIYNSSLASNASKNIVKKYLREKEFNKNREDSNQNYDSYLLKQTIQAIETTVNKYCSIESGKPEYKKQVIEHLLNGDYTVIIRDYRQMVTNYLNNPKNRLVFAVSMLNINKEYKENIINKVIKDTMNVESLRGYVDDKVIEEYIDYINEVPSHGYKTR